MDEYEVSKEKKEETKIFFNDKDKARSSTLGIGV